VASLNCKKSVGEKKLSFKIAFLVSEIRPETKWSNHGQVEF